MTLLLKHLSERRDRTLNINVKKTLAHVLDKDGVTANGVGVAPTCPTISHLPELG